jgi:hypothetical protein
MSRAHKFFIRTKKEDSAFLYHLLEAHEGLAAYSTLPHRSHDPFRDMELIVADEFKRDLELFLEELSGWVVILPQAPSSE